MTELDQLRELLDEASVSYLNHRGEVTIGYYTDDPHSVIEAMDHSLQVTGLTAKQVMRALGHSSNCTNSGRTCGEWRNASSYYDPTGVDAELWCEHCDEPLDVDWGFCPHCGRRIAPDCGRKVVSA